MRENTLFKRVSDYNVNGNTVKIDQDKITGGYVINIEYADGDGYVQAFPDFATLTQELDLLSNYLQFNADIETIDDIKQYIGGTYPDDTPEQQQYYIDNMAKRMGITE